jgi:hypothetical protein
VLQKQFKMAVKDVAAFATQIINGSAESTDTSGGTREILFTSRHQSGE